MTFSNEQTNERMTQLFEEGRRYFALQKDYLSLQSVETLTRLFTAIALTAIIILIGFLVVLFGSFALAYWLGDILDSAVLGFAIIAGVLFLCALLVYTNRNAWIIQPTTRFLVSLFAANSPLPAPTQEGIEMEKQRLQQQLTENQEQIKVTANNILAPAQEARNGWDMASNIFHNGMTIFRGVQVGLSIIAAVRSVFNLGGKRRRR